MLCNEIQEDALIPTDEQCKICDQANAKGHLQIVAFAGTGKTATLKMMAAEISEPKLYLAFNKRIIEEVMDDFPGEARTFNSLGHRTWMKTIPGKVVLDGKKTLTLFKEAIKKYSRTDADDLWDSYGEISEAVRLAKARGYIPTGVDRSSKRLVGEEFWSDLSLGGALQRKIVDEILAASIRLAYVGNIDYDDQLYMPTLFGGSFPRFPQVFVDEEQDLNPINHLMVDKVIRGGRLISVGDPFQSIYAFRGALQDGMAINRARRTMATATLSISFRCKSRIVENARWRVPEFKAFRLGGKVGRLSGIDSVALKDGSAIICRNNAPLFRTALSLLSSGRACRVAGSDIGPKLIRALERLGDRGALRPAVLVAIDEWEQKKDGRGDMAECMRIFAGASRDLDEAIRRAEFVLRQDGPITLITGHKAKGLEWETVYHIDEWLIGLEEQELNLRYVIQTRAKEEYYEVNSEDIRFA